MQNRILTYLLGLFQEERGGVLVSLCRAEQPGLVVIVESKVIPQAGDL